jgi:hypothetical protein
MNVYHNGVQIHDEVRLAKGGEPVTNTTAGRGGSPCQLGPPLPQDHGNLVGYRNIRPVPMKGDGSAFTPAAI